MKPPQHHHRTFSLLSVLACGLTGVVAAQQAPFDPFRPANNPQAQANERPAPVTNAKLVSSLELTDAPITTALDMLSDLTGWSIVTSAAVSKQPPSINIWVKDLTAEEVLEQIIRMGQLVADRSGDTIRVMTFEEHSRVYGTKKEVIQLKYADARDTVQILRSFAGEKDTSVVIRDSDDKVILLAPDALLESLLRIIEQLDVPLEEDTISLVSLKHLEPHRIVPSLEHFLGAQSTMPLPGTATGAAPAPLSPASARKWKVDFMIESDLRIVVVKGRPADVQRVTSLLANLDVQPGIETRGYALQYTRVREVFETIQEIINEDQPLGVGGLGLSGAGRLSRPATMPIARERIRVAASEQNNRIIVEGLPSDHAYLSSVIAAIDRPLPPGAGGFRVYRLRNAAAKEVAAVLQALVEGRLSEEVAKQAAPGSAPQPGSAPPPGVAPSGKAAEPAPSQPGTAPSEGETVNILPVRITAAEEINAVIIAGSASDHAELSAVIEALDKPREQVVLEVILVTLRSARSLDIGVELGGAYLGQRGANQVGFSNFGIGAINPATGDVRIATPPPLGLNYSVFDLDDYSLVLNMLQTVGDIRISSSPKVLVEDNAEGNISQLNQEPYEVTNQGEVTSTTSFGGFVDAGTSLRVTPHVSANSLRLDYVINLSAFGTRVNEALPPPRLQNTIQGTVRVPSGKMVVLGGIEVTRREDRYEGVPVLANVPVLGHLFRRDVKQDSKETLYVFVKPTVLRDPAFVDLLHMSDPEIKAASLFREQRLFNELKLFHVGEDSGAISMP